MNRWSLRDELLLRLRDELERAERAHHTTMAGVTHEEARPENSKDTRALEQSYLARGQAVRLEELRQSVLALSEMNIDGLDGCVSAGAVVTVCEEDETRVLYVAPCGGGTTLCQGTVQVLTPSSPIGRALLGRRAGDTVEITLAGRKRELDVVSVD